MAGVKHEHGERFEVIVVGGGHAGVEAAWAAVNLLGARGFPSPSVALVTLRADRIGAMSCNPAIGGLAKGQLVREIDALGGLMGLAADATGIQFRVLNTSKGPAVHGPRCQSDNRAYPRAVQGLIASRPEVRVIEGAVERLLVAGEGESGGPGRAVRRAIVGVRIKTPGGSAVDLAAGRVVLTTGTFMRGLMHTGDARTPGGRHGEAPADSSSASLHELGFELGRLKTGTPPRLRRGSLDWQSLPEQLGDAEPVPFSELTPGGWGVAGAPVCERFPLLEQVACRQTHTTSEAHELIRANLHRAPMFNGGFESAGPRYCPSIEDKVVRFAGREQHGVFLEPESLETDVIYCNGISSSLPADVQERVVRMMPGCERAEVIRAGYAVEYDMVRPHQIIATGETRLVSGFYLAGQINGTSGYEEAAAQGRVAGANAALAAAGEPPFELGREQAYIGVLMDDLVTKTPVEPYRMFTSRAEHRLLLRADNAPERLTPVAQRLGLLDAHDLGRQRLDHHAARTRELDATREACAHARVPGRDGPVPVPTAARRSGFRWTDLRDAVGGMHASEPVWKAVHAELRYEAYIERQRREIERHRAIERRPIPDWFDAHAFETIRPEARAALARFRPRTFGQAGRLEGMTPADLSLLNVLVTRASRARRPA